MGVAAITRRVVKLTVLIAVSIVILVAIVYAVGVAATLEAVRQAGAGAFAGVGATVLAALLGCAAALAALIGPIEHRVPFRTLFSAEVVGTAGNLVTPSTYLGGEPLKVAYIGKATGHRLHEVAGTVLLSKYMEMLSFVLFFSFSTAVAAVYYRDVLFEGPCLAAGVTLLLVAGGFLVMFGVLWQSLSRRWRPITRVLRVAVRLRLFKRLFARFAVRARVMEDQVSRVFREEGYAALLAFLAFLGTHIVVFLRPAVFFLIGGKIGLGLGPLCLIFVASQALLCFQLTPSGVGTLDGGLIGTFALVGLAEAHCMAFLLALRFWDVLIMGSGGFLAARVGTRLFADKPPPATELLETPAPADDTD